MDICEFDQVNMVNIT